jgi:hypothetical protein
MRPRLLMSRPGHDVVPLRWTGVLHDLIRGLSGHPGALRLPRFGSIFGQLATQGQ